MPYINLKSVIKYANKKFLKADSKLLGHENIFKFPLNTYVFVVK
ncbi:hypothetical protein [Helicobacter sp. 16-1353]|nr:hypothetical protein [Helicobacter sp. 16-1353]